MNRPFTSVNMAITVDGKITSSSRERPGFASGVDRRRMDQLRARADALLVGAGTVRADDPTWHVRTPELRKTGAAAPDRVVISTSADIPADSRFFNSDHGGTSILVTTRSAPQERLSRLAGRAEIWQLGEESVDFEALFSKLSERGVKRLLVEGGAELNWALFERDLVDELHVTLAPALLGGRDAPTLLDGRGWGMPDQRRLRLLELERDGDELFLRYAVERKADTGTD